MNYVYVSDDKRDIGRLMKRRKYQLLLIVFLGCYTVWLWESPTFWGYVLPPSSGSKVL
jgi:hypothetical protein